MATTLADVKQLARDLPPTDQAHLIEFLAARVAAAVAARHPPTPEEQAAAIQRFRAAMDRVAAGARSGESLTDAVSEMRR